MNKNISIFVQRYKRMYGSRLSLSVLIAVILVITFIAVSPCPCRGLEPEPGNAVYKRVVWENGTPIMDANVSLKHGTAFYGWQLTGPNGWANWTDLADGLWSIYVDADGDGTTDSKDEYNYLANGQVLTLVNTISPELHGYGARYCYNKKMECDQIHEKRYGAGFTGESERGC